MNRPGEPTLGYRSCVEREEELGRLQSQARNRKSMLVFGPQGAGKTRLLQALVQGQQLALYVEKMRSPRDLLLALLHKMHAKDETIKAPGSIAALSSTSLKGIVNRALDTQPFLLVLDHLEAPSRATTGMIKDLHYYGRTPVIFASRSPHMEDIGALHSFCASKSERLELKNLPSQIALEFAQREADRIGLRASNLVSILSSLVEWSGGNPGDLLHILRMAQLPQYRVGDQIKSHILYVDYRMGRR